jgi:Arc/MetJ-type ribon-helix-helix transcriptional regulator
MQKRKLKFWNIPVTAQLNECVEKAVQINGHVSKSDFVRDAVREKLTKMGLSPGQEKSKENAVDERK